MQARGLEIAVVAAFLLAGCDAPAPAIPESKRKEMQFERIAKLTKKSCMCAMAGRDTSKLESKLQQLTASLEKSGWATSSVPLRADMTCYPDLGDSACAGRTVLQKSPETNFVCSETQAIELDAVWKAAATDGPTYESLVNANKKRDEALLKRLRAMHAEAAAKIPQSACN